MFVGHDLLRGVSRTSAYRGCVKDFRAYKVCVKDLRAYRGCVKDYACL